MLPWKHSIGAFIFVFALPLQRQHFNPAVGVSELDLGVVQLALQIVFFQLKWQRSRDVLHGPGALHSMYDLAAVNVLLFGKEFLLGLMSLRTGGATDAAQDLLYLHGGIERCCYGAASKKVLMSVTVIASLRQAGQHVRRA